ncbi:MAG: hypothetical protein FK732_10175, partial [Asgard group archaeon]|nr:hypothetical protein [Asgard group archaeon]
IEIGQNELSNNEITVTRRDKLQKETIHWQSHKLREILLKIQKEIDDSMRRKAQSIYNGNIVDYSAMVDIDVLVKDSKLSQNKMYLISWCGSEKCARKIEQKTNFTLLGYDYQLKQMKKTKNKCLHCSTNGSISVLAKRY